MKLTMTLFIFISLSFLTFSCSPKKLLEDGSSVDPVEASIESGLTIVSGIADEQSGASLAMVKPASSSQQLLANLLLPTAMATSCTRAVYSSCTSGRKETTYSDCEVAGTSRTLQGQVTLNYSQSNCSLQNTGDTVIRTYDLEISGPRGGVVTHKSQTASDYRGISYGGGGQLTQTTSGWTIDILGRHTQLTYHGNKIFDVSVRTLAPLSVTGTLSRSGRTVTSGQLEVNHNLAGFTSVITPTNLQWSSLCCHPIGGQLAVSFSGRRTGQAQVSFNGCGSAVVNADGQQRTIQLSYCE